MEKRSRSRRGLVREMAELRGRVAQPAAGKAGRELSDESLGQSEQTALVLLNAIVDAALLVRPDGTLLALNEVAAQRLGGMARELVGSNFFELLTPDMAEEFRARATEVIKSGASVRYVYQDGGTFTDNSLFPVLRRAGKVDKLAIFSRDITRQALAELELHKARQAAQSADMAKSKFLANMSHELRTPLNAIIGFSEILEDQTFGELNEKQLRYARHIHSSGQHLLELINEILDLAKVESGKAELHISDVNFKRLLENSVVIIREKALRRRIHVDVRLQEELADLHVQADELKIKQIVFNLLSNAAKFTPEGGRIEISAHLEAEQVVISVADTGVGLKPQDQERIFAPFEQVDLSDTRQPGQGTGLGLALARSLVELHGGRIRVNSDGIGKGSTFIFTIPIRHNSRDVAKATLPSS
ncbi:MAG: ATP-binding protein [Desulfomonilaceae bacterium]